MAEWWAWLLSPVSVTRAELLAAIVIMWTVYHLGFHRRG